jgi:hypothetical protein
LRESSGIDFISLYLRMRDQPDLQWVRDCDPPYLRSQYPHDGKCVPCRFEYDLVVGREAVCKGCEAVPVELHSTQVAQSLAV